MTGTPSARRASAPGWRDPRLWIGVALVAASMVAGALVLGTSEDRVPVWAAADDLGEGHLLTAQDLTVRRVGFADPADEGRYLPADRPPPTGSLLRGVGAGELLPRSVVGRRIDGDLRQVPAAVAADQVPASVGAGDLVDLYLRPAGHSGCAEPSVCSGRPVLAAVPVLDAPPAEETFGSQGGRMLVFGVGDADARRFFRLLAVTDDPVLTVVGRG